MANAQKLTEENLHVANKMFVSIGYDFVRIGKAFTYQEVAYLKSICIESEGVFYLQKNRKITFQIYGTLIFLAICPMKLLCSENVILATPDEMSKALNKVQRSTDLNFWDGYVNQLHYTITIQTPEPFACYRNLLRTPKHYRHEKQDNGDYFNSERITILFYDKAKECEGEYSATLQGEFFGTFTPELFRAEIRLEKEVRKVLVESGFWDKKKTRFLASDLVSDSTFSFLTQYANRYILRFLKPMKNTIPQSIASEFSFFRVSCATDNGYTALTELHERGLLSEGLFRRATKHYNEAKEQQRNEYLRTLLTDKVTAILSEYEPKRSIDATAKRALGAISRSKIVTMPPKTFDRMVLHE